MSKITALFLMMMVVGIVRADEPPMEPEDSSPAVDVCVSTDDYTYGWHDGIYSERQRSIRLLDALEDTCASTSTWTLTGDVADARVLHAPTCLTVLRYLKEVLLQPVPEDTSPVPENEKGAAE